ncbi:MAG: hypothetical protein U5K76_09940 [Woeseiaceae bacterium]|nr:hypothetical protein [Woeseiaceae bacterium]
MIHSKKARCATIGSSPRQAERHTDQAARGPARSRPGLLTGVAYPCLKIKDDPTQSAVYTARGNLVGIVTNGSAVLGLGAIGPPAAKPVMEGKSVLFKKFAGIDAFDIEIDESDPERLVDIIARLEPTFGAINLEDIKAPECFIVEQKLTERMNIPVFTATTGHGAAIVASAAIRNGLQWSGKSWRTSNWFPPAEARQALHAWTCSSAWACNPAT